jgi:hypothetical protein
VGRERAPDRAALRRVCRVPAQAPDPAALVPARVACVLAPGVDRRIATTERYWAVDDSEIRAAMVAAIGDCGRHPAWVAAPTRGVSQPSLAEPAPSNQAAAECRVADTTAAISAISANSVSGTRIPNINPNSTTSKRIANDNATANLR